MHELSIALSILEGADEERERQGGGRVHAVHLKLGTLAGVVKEALTFSWSMVCDGTRFEGAQLAIEDIPVVVFCPVCRAERSPVSLLNFSCGVCGAPTYEVVRGRELEIAAMEMDE